MFEHASRRQVLASTGLLAAGALAPAVRGSSGGSDGGATPDAPPHRWTSTYDRTASDVPMDAVANEDGTVTVGGFTGGDTKPWVFRVADEGERQWASTFDVDEPTPIRGVAPAGDGSVLAGTRSESQDGATVTLFRVDGEGSRQWRKTYDTPGEAARTNAVASVDDGHVLVGTAIDSNQRISWALGVDAEGERRWLTTLSEYVLNFALSVHAGVDGGSLLTGAIRPEPTQSDSNPPYEGWVVKLDGSGEREWAERYTAQTSDGSGTVQIIYDATTTDDGYVLTGYVAPTFSGEGGRGWAMVTNASGQQDYGSVAQPGEDGTGRLVAVCPVADGYALVGTGQTSDGARPAIWAVGVDASLSRNWRFVQSFGDDDAVSDAVTTGDGGFLVVANTSSGGSGNANALTRKYGGDPVSTPTPTPTATPTPTPTPTPTATPTPTETPTDTPTTTLAPTPEPMTTDEAAAESMPADTTSGDGPGFDATGTIGALAALTGGAVLRRVRSRNGE